MSLAPWDIPNTEHIAQHIVCFDNVFMNQMGEVRGKKLVECCAEQVCPFIGTENMSSREVEGKTGKAT